MMLVLLVLVLLVLLVLAAWLLVVGVVVVGVGVGGVVVLLLCPLLVVDAASAPVAGVDACVVGLLSLVCACFNIYIFTRICIFTDNYTTGTHKHTHTHTH